MAGVTNPAKLLISLSDSLRLSENQSVLLRIEQAKTAEDMSRTLATSANELAALQSAYDVSAASHKMLHIALLAFGVLEAHADAVGQILTTEQRTRLPIVLNVLTDSRRVHTLRPSVGVGFGRAFFRHMPDSE